MKNTRLEDTAALYRRLAETQGRLLWETRVNLDQDHSRKSDILIQRWQTNVGNYLVQVWLDGSGWNIFTLMDNKRVLQEIH